MCFEIQYKLQHIWKSTKQAKVQLDTFYTIYIKD